MTKNKREQELKELRKDEEQLPDERNSKFIFSSTHTELLVQIANGSLNARKLAREELINRGLDKEGKWVGFRDR